MKILVTGGAGYIGSVMAALLVQKGHAVTVYDNLSLGHREAVGPDVELVVGDLADQEKLEAVFAGTAFDAVMHFAAFARVGESMVVPERYFRNNTTLTFSLVETMLRFGVRRFVFSSTAAVYGQPTEVPIPENAAKEPTNPYGESKLAVERMLDWLARIHDFRAASLRYFNAAGATEDLGEDHSVETHLIPLVLGAALGRYPEVSIYGTDYPTPDGTCIRDYVHVLDLAEAHLLVMEALEQERRLVYNLGNGTGFSVRQVINVAEQVTGKKIPSVEAPRRPGDPPVLVASSERIRRELGWVPEFDSLESIISSAWAWHSAHPDGYGARPRPLERGTKQQGPDDAL